jgi:predicted GTPase
MNPKPAIPPGAAMPSPRPTAAELIAWYTEQARPFLLQHVPDDVVAIDQQKARLEQIVKAAEEEVAACFLGSSGVGKSTLLNGLVDDRVNVLPHGGVGPLTAQATEVRYAEETYFKATYLPARELHKIRFAFETALLREGGAAPASIGAEDLAAGLDEEARQEAEAALPTREATREPEAHAEGLGDKLEAYQRQARLLVRGNQQADLSLGYLADAVRLMLGNKPRWGQALTAEDQTRVEHIRACLQKSGQEGPHHERRLDGNRDALLRELREHASGFLAPLIKDLEVGWNAELLREGLVLIDLPGVGVANDEYRRVTHERIRAARAVVLVVDHRGVTEASAEILRRTGFLNGLLHDSHDAASDPVMLSVVVVQVDKAADAAWRDERDRQEDEARAWTEHFEDVCAQAVEMVRAQMRQELHKLSTDGGEATRVEQRAAVDRLLEAMEVHPVSALQHRRFVRQDPDDLPRVKSAEQSRLPGLRRALREQADAQVARQRARAAAANEDFGRRVGAALALLHAQWQADERAEREATALREELDAFLAPRKRELEVRRAAFREFLRESVPAQIEARVDEAAAQARMDIDKYLRGKLGKLHWATLRATVRKGGAHVSSRGEHIDLANELALRFEGPVAVVWSKHILCALRKRTAELGQDYVGMTGEVVTWARGQDARVQPRFVEALHENLGAQTKDLSSVGKEAVDELKGRVRSQLNQKTVEKVRRRCDAFIADRKDKGAGVKGRILELFHDELAASVVEIAQPVAKKVLGENYGTVEGEISARFSAYKNPLETARDALVSSHEDSVRRSDARKRKRVLADIEEILAGKPSESAAR